MRIKQVQYSTGIGGPSCFERIVEVPDRKLLDGESKVDPKTPLAEWKQVAISAPVSTVAEEPEE